MIMKINTSIRLFLIATLLLSGCSQEQEITITQVIKPVAKEKSQATSPKPTYNRTFQHILRDEKIAKTIQGELRRHPSLLQNTKIKAVVFDSKVYLIGGALTKKLSREAQQIVNSKAEELNISRVFNYLKIGPLSNTSTSDIWLETKVKAMLLSSQLAVNHVQVSCYNDVIYLIGSTKPGQSKLIKQYLTSQLGSRKIIMYLKENMVEST